MVDPAGVPSDLSHSRAASAPPAPVTFPLTPLRAVTRAPGPWTSGATGEGSPRTCNASGSVHPHQSRVLAWRRVEQGKVKGRPSTTYFAIRDLEVFVVSTPPLGRNGRWAPRPCSALQAPGRPSTCVPTSHKPRSTPLSNIFPDSPSRRSRGPPPPTLDPEDAPHPERPRPRGTDPVAEQDVSLGCWRKDVFSRSSATEVGA